MKNDTAKGYSIALISAVILSTTAIFIRYLTSNYDMPPLVLAFWRDLFVVISLMPILLITCPSLIRIDRKKLGFLILYGFILMVFNILWTLSVAWNGASVATILVYTSTIFTAILGCFFLKEKPGIVKMLAISMSIFGSVLVAEVFSQNQIHVSVSGVTAGILSGLGYAIYSLLGKKSIEIGINSWTSILYTFGFAALFLMAINLLPFKILPGSAVTTNDFLWLGDSWKGWAILFLLAAGPTLLGFGLYTRSMLYLSASVANLLATLEPVFTMLIAYFLLAERMSVLQGFGSALILAAVISLRISEERIIWLRFRHIKTI